MNIVFDNLIFSLQKAGGISVVWGNLLSNCIGRAKISFIEYFGAENNLSRNVLNIPSVSIKYKSINPKLAELLTPKVLYNGNEPFIFHSSYFRICKHSKAINITTVHDFIYEQGKPTLKQKLRIALNYKAIRKSDAIVCISENSKRDLLKFIPDIDASKISVIYNGVSESYNKISKKPYPEYSNHILFVGGRQGYKNFRFIVEALSGTNYPLLICGKSLSNEEKTMLDSYLPKRYKFVSLPSNEELNKIYNSVYALVYPSSYEGFGIPILEAQRAQCPVIALNSSSIPEVAGNGAILLDSIEPSALIDALDKLSDTIFRSSLIKNGYINSKRFSWGKMANGYMALYEQLYNQRLKQDI